MPAPSALSRLKPDHGLDYLLLVVPVAIVLGLLHAPPVLIFAVSAVGIIPLAGVLGRSTEHLAQRAGPGIGGLLNATFGNAAELIIAASSLSRGLGGVVKASITGSIIGNCLLVLGLAVLAGGLKHPIQRFNRTAASLGSTLMALAAIGMIVPTIFWYSAQVPAGTGGPEQGHASTGHMGGTEPGAADTGVAGSGSGQESAGGMSHAPAAPLDRLEKGLSLEIAVILGAVYLLSLLFSLRTHKHLYAGDAEAPGRETEHAAEGAGSALGRGKPPSVARAIGVLLASSALIAVLSELLVGALEPTAAALGLTDLFVGVVVVAIVGNAAEHSSAVFAAMKNEVDLAMHIAVGSSLQIALFVTPLLLGLSYFVGPAPIDLHFTLFEVAAVVLAVLALNLVCQDGETNWMEGVLLLAVYAILGIAFYFLPA